MGADLVKRDYCSFDGLIWRRAGKDVYLSYDLMLGNRSRLVYVYEVAVMGEIISYEKFEEKIFNLLYGKMYKFYSG